MAEDARANGVEQRISALGKEWFDSWATLGWFCQTEINMNVRAD
jgi:hypothetical protein